MNYSIQFGWSQMMLLNLFKLVENFREKFWRGFLEGRTGCWKGILKRKGANKGRRTDSIEKVDS